MHDFLSVSRTLQRKQVRLDYYIIETCQKTRHQIIKPSPVDNCDISTDFMDYDIHASGNIFIQVIEKTLHCNLALPSSI